MKQVISAVIACTMIFAASSAWAQTVFGARDPGTGKPTFAAITTDTEWCGATNPGPIILDGAVFVVGATLTILPGCIVRGQPRSAAAVSGSVLGSPGSLTITQTGRLIADGSASNPIIFTTAATDNDGNNEVDLDVLGDNATWEAGDTFYDDDPAGSPLAPLSPAGADNVQLWGGVVILGNAPTNLSDEGAGAPYGQGIIEGFSVPGFPASNTFYGGPDFNDDSGVLNYVSIRHAGDAIGTANELNGLTLGGVGAGTQISNVEIFTNFDDGIEWFGGTVNSRNLMVAYQGDDGLDFDQGYTGSIQNAIVLMPFFTYPNGQSGDKGGEIDGSDGDCNVQVNAGGTEPGPGTCFPASNPLSINITILGGNSAVGTLPGGIATSLNNGSWDADSQHGGILGNSIILNTGTADAWDSGGTTVTNMYVSNTTNGAYVGPDTLAAVTAGNGYAIEKGGNPVLSSNFCTNGVAAGCQSPGSFLGLISDNTFFDPTGDASGKLVKDAGTPQLNLHPVGALGTLGATDFGQWAGIESTTYRGAADSNPSNPHFADGWTVLSTVGILAP